MGQVDELHAVVEEGKAFADVVTLNILGPGWRSQDVSYHWNARQEDGWRVVQVVPTADSGETAADVNFNFRGRHVPHMLAKIGQTWGPRWSFCGSSAHASKLERARHPRHARFLCKSLLSRERSAQFLACLNASTNSECGNPFASAGSNTGTASP